MRAALANHLQWAIYILLGSALATIGLTIPAVLAFALLSHKPTILSLVPVDITMLALTLVLSTLTLSSSRTNVLPGSVRLLLLFACLLPIFQRCPGYRPRFIALNRNQVEQRQVERYSISRCVAIMCASARCASAQSSLIIADGSQSRLFSNRVIRISIRLLSENLEIVAIAMK